MAGKWTKRSSDNCSYQQEVIESTGPIDYMLNSGYHRNCGLCCSKNNCCSEKNLKQEQSKTHTNRITLENELFNITKLSSKCNNLKHKPGQQKTTDCLHRNEQPCYDWLNGVDRPINIGFELKDTCNK
tara:strand:- start:301 stop:684 length:384 start_codon:yes stop_codon:yes gene_type:complete